jgi:hypothetical protein
MKSSNYYDVICLADNEWGNQIMREVAEQFFRDNPDCNFVEVREHAGWWLGFHRSMEVIGTANDLAVLRPDRPRPDCLRDWVRRPVLRPDLREVDTLAAYSSHPSYTLQLLAA